MCVFFPNVNWIRNPELMYTNTHFEYIDKLPIPLDKRHPLRRYNTFSGHIFTSRRQKNVFLTSDLGATSVQWSFIVPDEEGRSENVHMGLEFGVLSTSSGVMPSGIFSHLAKMISRLDFWRAHEWGKVYVEKF